MKKIWIQIHVKKRQMINFNDIQHIICEGEEGVTEENISSDTRSQEIVFARQLVFSFLKKYTKYSLKKIGSFYNKDHATVLSSIAAVNNRIDTDKIVKRRYMEYDIKIYKLDNLKNEVYKDWLLEISERVMQQIKDYKPIDYDLIIVYNRLIEKL